MSEVRTPKATTLARDDKTTLVMIYTANSLIRGEAITKESIRVNIWLRTQSSPDYIHLLKASALVFGPGPVKQYNYAEYIVPTSEVLAFHLAPPAQETLDYAADEVNRTMEPVTALVGTFRFDGMMRLSTMSDIFTNLTVAHSQWMSLYNLEISNPFLSAMGVMKVPMTLVRPQHVLFGYNTATPEANAGPETPAAPIS
jgi:hypothetical protein